MAGRSSRSRNRGADLRREVEETITGSSRPGNHTRPRHRVGSPFGIVLPPSGRRADRIAGEDRMHFVLPLLAAVPFAQSDTPDLIVLEDGKELECRVLYEDDETVVYTTRRKAKELPRAEVQSVRSIRAQLARVPRRLRRAARTSPGRAPRPRGLLRVARAPGGGAQPLDPRAHARSGERGGLDQARRPLLGAARLAPERCAGASTPSRTCASASATGRTPSSSPRRTS